MFRQKIENLLKNHKDICHRISCHEEKIINYREIIRAKREISGVSYNDDVKMGGISDSTYAAVESIENYLRELNRSTDELKRLYDRRYLVEQMLTVLDEKERLIVKTVYIDHVRWAYVPPYVNYSESQARRINERALVKLEFMLTSNENLLTMIAR